MLSDVELAKLKKILTGNEDLAPIFRILSDPTRCNIFRAFLPAKRLCVTDIVNLFSISMSSASQHLKTLEQGEMLRRERVGREIYYFPSDKNKIVNAIKRVVQS